MANPDISLESRGDVSPQVLGFVSEVVEKESLGHWRVHIWTCRSEGLCTEEEIVFGLCSSELRTKLLFLHEVAHALRSHIDWSDSYWHRDGWDKEYGRLCRDHLGIGANEYEEVRGLFI